MKDKTESDMEYSTMSEMESTTYENVWQSAKRTYVLVKIDENMDKREVARAIYGLNQDTENPDYLIIRVSPIIDAKNRFDLIVSVCARNMSILNEIVAAINDQQGLLPDNTEELYQDDELESRESNFPWPPHEAACYIPVDESNPSPPGFYPTGRNAWG